ncbi:MAG: GNAT family N-acetyltransferase [Aeromicrobium sp.]|uniref:GNAT family N-acetyltransferase n=1 Tax=Aeromicrobium sp. TaxID=1871063 RepID=UPI0039E61414
MNPRLLKLVPYQSKRYDYTSFACGHESMDTWLQRHAGQNERLNRARTFLLVDRLEASRQIYGYFSLLNYQIVPSEATLVLNRRYRYPMPATLLARLAVASGAQNRGLGKLLLVRAMEHVLVALEHSASEVLLVDAIDDNAVAFYRRHGFQLLHGDGRRMFLPTQTIRASLDGSRPSH